MTDLSQLLSIASIGLAIGSIAYTWRRNAYTDNKEIWKAITDGNAKLAVLEAQNKLFWNLVEQQLAKALIRPTHLEMDELLKKVVAEQPLTYSEEDQLMEMLRATVEDKNEVAGVRAMGATILAIRLAKRQAEEELNA